MNIDKFEIEFKELNNNKLVLLNSTLPRIYVSSGYTELAADDKSIPLLTAITQGIVNAEDLADKAQIDSELGKCQKLIVKDGGSLLYIYSNFNLVKFNNIEGVKDLLIGPKDLNLSLLDVSKSGINLAV